MFNIVANRSERIPMSVAFCGSLKSRFAASLRLLSVSNSECCGIAHGAQLSKFIIIIIIIKFIIKSIL